MKSSVPGMAEDDDTNSTKKKNLDYILDNLVGGGSWYQWTTLLAMAPLWISEWPMTVSFTHPYRAGSPICF